MRARSVGNNPIGRMNYASMDEPSERSSLISRCQWCQSEAAGEGQGQQVGTAVRVLNSRGLCSRLLEWNGMILLLAAHPGLALVFLPSLVAFVALDFIWISLVAAPMFKEALGDKLRPTPDIVAGALAWYGCHL